jgi:serpin B
MKQRVSRSPSVSDVTLPDRLKVDVPGAGLPGKAASESINQFGIDFYGLLSQEDNESNLLLSPFSIASALAMTLTGARGATAEQLADALYFTELGDQLRAELRELRELHQRLDLGESSDLRTANGLWGHTGHEFLESFREDVRDIFGGVLRDVDFEREAESVRREINDWVSDVTHEKIQDLLSRDAVDAMTRLILANALYFRARWDYTFDPEMTTDEPFFLLDGQRVVTPMMHQKEHHAHLETNRAQALTIPYQAPFDMVVVLPKKRDGLTELEARIRSGRVRPWVRKMKMREVVLSLPKFRIETAAGLSGWLKNLGVSNVFDRQRADLSGMATRESIEKTENLYLSEIFHKTYIDVDETGTEAAAATAGIVCTAARNPPPPVIFTADVRVRAVGDAYGEKGIPG